MDSLGRHIIIELYNCNQEKIDDVLVVQATMEKAAVEAGATLINTTFHHFAPFGVSGVVVIQESHLSVHTWPEYGFASVDIFTCGESVDPWQAVGIIQNAFEASHHSAVEMLRGQKSQLKKVDAQKYTHTNIPPQQLEVQRQVWFTEKTDNYALSIKHKGDLLFKEHTAHQRIEVYYTDNFGKMLVLDGVIVLTEKDGFVYHEMISHVPLLSYDQPKNVLILGGGDGAVATEVLKHKYINKIDIFEIDRTVPNVVKEQFPHFYQAFENKKVAVFFEDILQKDLALNTKKYDVILDDLHSPMATKQESENPYIHLKNMHEVMHQDSLLVTSVGSPHLDRNQFKINIETLHNLFGKDCVACYLATIPTFPTGLWCFALCGSLNSKKNRKGRKYIDEFIAQHDFQYYTSQIHQSAFVLPAYLQKVIFN